MILGLRTIQWPILQIYKNPIKASDRTLVADTQSGSPTRLLLDFANFPKSVGDHVYGHWDLSMDMGTQIGRKIYSNWLPAERRRHISLFVLLGQVGLRQIHLQIGRQIHSTQQEDKYNLHIRNTNLPSKQKDKYHNTQQKYLFKWVFTVTPHQRHISHIVFPIKPVRSSLQPVFKAV